MATAPQPTLDDVISALDRLLKIFDWERKLYLAFGLVSLFLFVYSGYRMIGSGQIDKELMSGMLGASGVVAACSARVVFFLTKAFNIVEQIAIGASHPKGGANGN